MTYPDKVSLSVTIDGNNVEDYILDGVVTYSDVLTARANTWSFTLEDPANVPNDWDEVIVLDGATKLLAGYVITVEKQRRIKDTSTNIHYRCYCGSYGARMARHYAKEEYEDKTDAYIIDDLLTTYASDINGTTYVTALKTYEKIRFNRKSLHSILEQLAANAGAQWYIDTDKNLHFFLSEENDAPYDISDDPDLSDTFPASNIVINTDGSNVINRVEVVGGSYLSESNEYFYLQGTGASKIVTFPFKMDKPSDNDTVQVWRNDGDDTTPSWTALTVLTGDEVDDLSANTQVVYYAEGQKLEGYEDWPELSQAVRIRGRRYIPLRYRKRNQESYDHYGQWFDDVVVDYDIVRKEDASIVASSKLSENALATTLVTCEVYEHGLKAGQTIHIENTDLGLDDTYLIHRIDAEIGQGGFAVYTLELGAYSKDLIDYLMKLVKSLKETATWREDEVLDEVFDEYETITLTESTQVTADEGPYNWGSFDWGYAKWGT